MPPDAEIAFAKVYRRMGLNGPPPRFRVGYYPFAGLRSTISRRGAESPVEARLSDLLVSAPALVLEALAEILIASLFRRRPSREARDCYRAYVLAPAMRRRIDAVRRERGTKHLLTPRGKCYDLEKLFAGLNRNYFGGKLLPPRLGWSLVRARTVLGHYDSAHRTITVSRWLDSPSVPRYVVEYLVFHEMLHMRFPTERKGTCRILHSPAFRVAEKQFPQFRQARRYLKRIAAL